MSHWTCWCCICSACAQATEGYDGKLGNDLTNPLYKQAFEILYDAIMNDKPENCPYGSMLSGMILVITLQLCDMHCPMCSQTRVACIQLLSVFKLMFPVLLRNFFPKNGVF